MSQHVANLPKNTPFLAPDGYFDGFHGKIMDRILTETSVQETIELSPLLSALKKENPYAIPEGYFNNVKFEFPEQPAAVVKRMFNLKQFIKYAAAACITGILAAILLMPKQMDNTQIAKTEVDIEIPSSKLSPDAFAFYLEEMDNFFIAEPTENEQISDENNLLVDINKTTIKEILQEIPDNEISNYINQNGFENVQSVN